MRAARSAGAPCPPPRRASEVPSGLPRRKSSPDASRLRWAACTTVSLWVSLCLADLPVLVGLRGREVTSVAR